MAQNNTAGTILSLGVVLLLLYIFRQKLSAAGGPNIASFAGAPTPPWSAGGLPYDITVAGTRVGEVVPGLGYIPQSQLDQNPNSPSGSLGITGYD